MKDKKKTKTTKTKKKLKAFVIMPFEDEFNIIYEQLIKPGLKNFKVKRADSIDSQQNILKDIIRGISDSDLVVADLTSKNPNVFYELGISHTLKKPTILLTQSIDDVPFDLKSYRMVKYSLHFNDAPKLKDDLFKIGESLRKDSLSFGNPVTDFLTENEIDESSLIKRFDEESEKKEGEKLLCIEEEKGLLDYWAGWEDSTENLTNYFSEITDATKLIGEKMQKRTNEVENIRQSQILNKASKTHKIAIASSVDMNQYAKKLENVQPKFHDEWNLFYENTSGFFKTSKIRDEEDKKAVLDIHTGISENQEALKIVLKHVKDYREVVFGLEGISREVTQASKRTVKILDLLLSDLESAESNNTKLITLIDEKIESTKIIDPLPIEEKNGGR